MGPLWFLSSQNHGRNRGIEHFKWNLLLNVEYHSIKRYLTGILFLGKTGTPSPEGSLLCGTTRVSLRKPSHLPTQTVQACQSRKKNCKGHYLPPQKNEMRSFPMTWRIRWYAVHQILSRHCRLKDMCKDHFWFGPKWKKMCSQMVKFVQNVGKNPRNGKKK